MEEKKLMTSEQLEAKLNSLHHKEKMWRGVAMCGFVLTFISGVVTGNVLVVLLFLVIMMVIGCFWIKSSNDVKSFLSENVINGVLTEVFGDTVEYKPFEKLNPGGVVVPFHYIGSEGENYIKGVYNGVPFELGDIRLIDEEEYTGEDGDGTDKVTRLKGQWLICDWDNAPACDVYVSELETNDRRIMTSDVKIADNKFRERFCVRADNPQEAYKILTPQMMERISAAADKCEGTVYMSFLREGKMNFAMKNEHELFELQKGKLDVNALHKKFRVELSRFTEIIDILFEEEKNV
ncbi:MAG: DUF3137 domain-containing protein [Oscillospiraceae bacterium]